MMRTTLRGAVWACSRAGTVQPSSAAKKIRKVRMDGSFGRGDAGDADNVTKRTRKNNRRLGFAMTLACGSRLGSPSASHPPYLAATSGGSFQARSVPSSLVERKYWPLGE